jgi:hypothetical protein
MVITRHILTEDSLALYRALHDEVFPPDPGHMPAFVYIAQDEKGYIGFAAGYAHRAATFYVSKAGCRRERIREFGFFRKVWVQAQEDGFRTIMACIENTNRPVLLQLLRDGFTVCGFRVAGDRQLVEVIKEMD